MSSIWIGKEIEVTHINPLVKSIGIVIHVYESPDKLLTPEAQEKVASLVKIGCKYLQDEGFIPIHQPVWIVHIGGVSHAK